MTSRSSVSQAIPVVRRHGLSPLLVSAAVFGASCGGGKDGSPVATIPSVVPAVGSGTLPLYQSSTEILNLPQLQAAGNLYSDVKLRLGRDGSWALLSTGSVRAVTAADTATSVLGPPGNSPDLTGQQTDATLSIARAHVDAKVFGNLALRLVGKIWSVAGDLRELKALTQEDFKANPALQADESHHASCSNPNYIAPTCASAYQATMNNTQFDSAYISNVDMGNVTGAGVDFSNAMLFGVSFAGANLAYANFTGAYVDLGSTCMQVSLIKDYANFPGYKLPVSAGSSTCVAGTQTAPCAFRLHTR